MNTWFTSDWHIGHENVLHLSERPFKDLEEMHKCLVSLFNTYVSRNDVTWFLGDMGICSSELLKQVINQLNGKKILILGNHDSSANIMYQVGFHAVMYNASLYVDNKLVSMSHCPLPGLYRENTMQMRRDRKQLLGGQLENWRGETSSKFQKFIVKDSGQFHLHGHIHSPNRGLSSTISGRQYDVGVDGNGFMPISLSKIKNWVNK